MAGITAFTPTTPLLPTSSSSVAPVPTVIPGEDPVFQEMQDTGRRTLWYVFIYHMADTTGDTDGTGW